VNVFDNEGRTALVLATDNNGHLESIMALFEAEADVNSSDPMDVLL
jgi:ankyrin repeat protein